MLTTFRLRWYARQLRRNSPEGQVRAIEALARIGAEGAHLPLILALEAESAQVRKRAAKALGEMRIRAAGPFLEDVLFKDSDSMVRIEAAKAIVRLPDHRPFIALSRRLQQDSSTAVRKEAARLLGQISPTQADVVNILVRALDDPDEEVRQVVAAVLDALNWEPPSAEESKRLESARDSLTPLEKTINRLIDKCLLNPGNFEYTESATSLAECVERLPTKRLSHKAAGA